jgi:DNA polymerase III alpha subunit
LDEDLAKILDVSYGIAVYQEQLMFIVQYMA